MILCRIRLVKGVKLPLGRSGDGVRRSARIGGRAKEGSFGGRKRGDIL